MKAKKDRVLFTRCDEGLFTRALKLAAIMAKRSKKPVSSAEVVRTALEELLKREGL